MNFPRTRLTVFSDLQGRERSRRGLPLDQASVRDLAEYSGDPVVTSLYIDIDGRTRPALAECDTALEMLFRQARDQAEQPGAANAVEDDLARIEEWIAAGVDRAHTKGLALFSCAADRFLRAFTLPVGVTDHVSVGVHPDVRQLEEIIDRARTLLVVLTDSQQARLVEARLGAVTEVATIVDPPERQVDTDVELGSWEHRHEEAVRRHLRRVSSAVAQRLDTRRIDGLVLAGPAPAADGLLGLLPPRAADRIVGRLSLPVHALEEELHQSLSDLANALEAERESELVIDLRSKIGLGQGASGLAESLAAINDKRVDTVVIARGYTANGDVCPSCGHMGAGQPECPWCAAATEAVDDVVAEAVDRAVVQHARIEYVPGASISDLGPIAVITRHG